MPLLVTVLPFRLAEPCTSIMPSLVTVTPGPRARPGESTMIVAPDAIDDGGHPVGVRLGQEPDRTLVVEQRPRAGGERRHERGPADEQPGGTVDAGGIEGGAGGHTDRGQVGVHRSDEGAGSEHDDVGGAEIQIGRHATGVGVGGGRVRAIRRVVGSHRRAARHRQQHRGHGSDDTADKRDSRTTHPTVLPRRHVTVRDRALVPGRGCDHGDPASSWS